MTAMCYSPPKQAISSQSSQEAIAEVGTEAEKEAIAEVEAEVKVGDVCARVVPTRSQILSPSGSRASKHEERSHVSISVHRSW